VALEAPGVLATASMPFSDGQVNMDKKEERKIKHDRVCEYLTRHDLDAVLLARRCNFSWYTCGAHNHVGLACDVGSSWLLVTQDAARVITTNIEATRLRAEELAQAGIEVVEFPYHDPAETAETFRKAVGSMRLAVDAEVPGLDAPRLDGDFDRLRWQLTEAEMQRYRALATDAVAAVETVARKTQPGQTENDLAGMLAAELYGRNCNLWAVLIGADDRIVKYRHPLPTEQPVEKYFMLIACAERDGLICSCTRLASFAALSEELEAKHRAVADVDAALILATRPGAKLCEVYAEGQAAYEAGGFPDEWRLHHQGGPCGYLARDLLANPTEQTVALADQAFAWNPSITGTKSEDTILCRPDGPEVLGMSDDWPRIEGQWKGGKVPRAAILVR